MSNFLVHISVLKTTQMNRKMGTKSVQIIKGKFSNEVHNYQYCFNFKDTPFHV